MSLITKVDFEVQGLDAFLGQVRVGQEVRLGLVDGILQCRTQEGAVLGTVPGDKYTQIPKTAQQGLVRSLRKAPSGQYSQVLVRITSNPQAPFLPSGEPPTLCLCLGNPLQKTFTRR